MDPNTPPADPAETDRLWRAYRRARTIAARNSLALCYGDLVRLEADRVGRRLPPEVPAEDLIQEGTRGLLHAIKAFRVSRGFKFETFARPRVRGAILDGLRGLDWVPKLRRRRAAQIERARRQHFTLHGDWPTDEQLRRSMGLTKAAFRRALEDADQPHVFSSNATIRIGTASQNEHMHDGGQRDAGECAGHDVLQGLEGAAPERAERSELLAEVLSLLDEREAFVVRSYYFDHLSMSEIAAVLPRVGRSKRPVTESRVSQIHGHALRRVRAIFEERARALEDRRHERRRAA